MARLPSEWKDGRIELEGEIYEEHEAQRLILNKLGLDIDSWDFEKCSPNPIYRNKTFFTQYAYIIKPKAVKPNIEVDLGSPVKRKRSTKTSLGTYMICISDPQLGKPGTDHAVHNWEQGLAEHLEVIQRHLENGEKIDGIHVAFMGDEHEGISSSFASQPYESGKSGLNYADQIQLDIKMRLKTIKTVATTGLPISVSSVPSNHGEHARRGGNTNVTEVKDNSSLMVARIVEGMVKEAGRSDIKFFYPNGNSSALIVNLSGVNVYFTHGYLEQEYRARGDKRKLVAALCARMYRAKKQAQVFVSGHHHHFWFQPVGDELTIGCPALEYSSEYYSNYAGEYSLPGIYGGFVHSRYRNGAREGEIFPLNREDIRSGGSDAII